MDILLLRHAKAEERSIVRRDRHRALTAAGRRDMAKAARGLQRLLTALDVVGSSPLTRARQTAEILARRYNVPQILELEELAPGASPGALLEWLRGQSPDGVIALVGHEPDLGRLAAFLLTGRAGSFVPLKKAGACLIRLDGDIEAGSGKLAWLVPPRALRALA
jgi:phosphohistidine phosphatase